MKIELVEETEIKKLVRKQDFKSDVEYREYLAKRKGFDSDVEYRKHKRDLLAKKKGFDSRAEYDKHKKDLSAQKKGYEDRLERQREYSYDVLGQLPMSENKDCPAYLGVNIAEKILAHIFKKENVERMPYGHKGYDFICGKGKKVDVKSSSLHSYYYWKFNIRNNKIAEQFLLLAFDERSEDDKNLKPMRLWLVPSDIIIRGEEFWNRETIQINNTPFGLREFEKYELKEGLEHLLECCEK